MLRLNNSFYNITKSITLLWIIIIFAFLSFLSLQYLNLAPILEENINSKLFFFVQFELNKYKLYPLENGQFFRGFLPDVRLIFLSHEIWELHLILMIFLFKYFYTLELYFDFWLQLNLGVIACLRINSFVCMYFFVYSFSYISFFIYIYFHI